MRIEKPFMEWFLPIKGKPYPVISQMIFTYPQEPLNKDSEFVSYIDDVNNAMLRMVASPHPLFNSNRKALMLKSPKNITIAERKIQKAVQLIGRLQNLSLDIDFLLEEALAAIAITDKREVKRDPSKRRKP